MKKVRFRKYKKVLTAKELNIIAMCAQGILFLLFFNVCYVQLKAMQKKTTNDPYGIDCHLKSDLNCPPCSFEP